MQAVAVAFDVVFAEPDRTSAAEIVKHARNLDDATRELLVHLPNNDKIFAEVIGRGKVVVGQSGAGVIGTRSLEKFPETAFATIGPDPRPYLVGFPHLLRNIPELEQSAAGRGLFSISPERDGIIRRVPIVMTIGDTIVPALTLDLLRVVAESNAILIRTDESGVRSAAVPGLELPTDRNGRIWVHFGRHDERRYVSAKDVIEGKVEPERLAGKLVLVGASAIGLLDVKTTPIDRAMPGVEVHAQLLEAALTNALLTSPSYAIVVEMLGALVAGTALSLLAPFASALTLFATAVFAAVVFIASSWIAYSRYQMLLDPVFPLIALISVYTSLILMGYFREQLDRPPPSRIDCAGILVCRDLPR